MSNFATYQTSSIHFQHNSNSTQTHTNSNLINSSHTPDNKQTIIKLKKSQRYLHPDQITATPQPFSRYLQPKHPILGEYQTFLSQFQSGANSAEPHRSADLLNPYTEQTKAALESILTQYEINHAANNATQQHTIYLALQAILYNINQAIEQITNDQFKTGGAAVQRRARAIKQYNTARSNYNLLLTATRQAISSTVRLRRTLQDSTDDQTKYILTKANKTITYQSKIFAADYNSITSILNPDLHYLYQYYKLTIKLLPKLQQLIARYNAVLAATDQNSLRRSLQISNK